MLNGLSSEEAKLESSRVNLGLPVSGFFRQTLSAICTIQRSTLVVAMNCFELIPKEKDLVFSRWRKRQYISSSPPTVNHAACPTCRSPAAPGTGRSILHCHRSLISIHPQSPIPVADAHDGGPSRWRTILVLLFLRTGSTTTHVGYNTATATDGSHS